MSKEKKKNWKKKAAVGAVCVAASAGVIVGGAFDSPADLMNDDGGIIASMQNDGDGDSSADNEERGTKRAVARKWIYALPAGVRALVCVPLWFVGWGILHLCALVWTPLSSALGSWLLTAVLVLLAVLLTAKAVFPDVPLKKLLKPKLILGVLAGVAVFGVADMVLPLFWEDCPDLSGILHLTGSVFVLSGATVFLVRKRIRLERKRKMKKEEKEELTVQQKAMALADTVCKPRY